MKRKWFSEEQICSALMRVERGAAVADVCRAMMVSEERFYQWKRKFSGMSGVEMRRLRALERENAEMKRLIAQLTTGDKLVQS